ncbi:MAG: hypothetical protein M1836_006392 [Candelina mexicana]|nr:MAG: hypothetical protein M1836_006392 [Candelina mexicana]
MSDLDKAIAQLRACRPIPEAQVRELCYKARELLIEEGNVVSVDAPVTVRRPNVFMQCQMQQLMWKASKDMW